MAQHILVHIRQSAPSLRPSERRIAEAALADPAAVAQMSISELARTCRTSTATVVRFCRSIGFDGYREFCLALARAAGADETGRRRFGIADGDIDPGDALPEIARKLAFQEARTVEESARMLDIAAVERTVNAIVNAPSVIAFGLGSSATVAQDLCQKLQRIGCVVTVCTDVHLAASTVAGVSEGTVVILFSNSGETAETTFIAGVAARAGAFVVGVTNFPESSLAQSSDVVLLTASREARLRYGAMSSRMAQLLVADVIFVGTARRHPDEVSKRLEASLAAVESWRQRTRRNGKVASS